MSHKPCPPTRNNQGCTAQSAGKEAALLFPTGFAANVGAIAALASGGGPSHIFSDALNHASIIDGARLAQRAGAMLHVYRHSDMRHLEELLLRVPRGERRAAVELEIGRKVPENVWKRLAHRAGAMLHVFWHSDMRQLGELLLKVPRGARHPLCCVA